MRTQERRDIYAEITSKILASIEANPGQPELPWHRPTTPLVLPVNVASNAYYRGVNIVCLWCASDTYGYRVPLFGTYKQWQAAGAQVRKGEKGHPVVFYKDYEVEPDSENPDDDGKRRVARASWVFNVAQVDGFDVPAIQSPPDNPIQRIEQAETLVAAINADIRHGGTRAYYRPAGDYIQMPDEHLFKETANATRSEGYYATLFHELTHFSGVPKRLNRELGKRFGDHAYAMEELVAELGASFLCAELGIGQTLHVDSAAYLNHWIKAMREDNRVIFAAATKASEAATYLKTFSTNSRTEDHEGA